MSIHVPELSGLETERSQASRIFFTRSGGYWPFPTLNQCSCNDAHHVVKESLSFDTDCYDITISPYINSCNVRTGCFHLCSCSAEASKIMLVRSDRRLLPASYPHPVYNDRNRNTNVLSEPEIYGSECDIHMFFRCRSIWDEIRFHFF